MEQFTKEAATKALEDLDKLIDTTKDADLLGAVIRAQMFIEAARRAAPHECARTSILAPGG